MRASGGRILHGSSLPHDFAEPKWLLRQRPDQPTSAELRKNRTDKEKLKKKKAKEKGSYESSPSGESENLSSTKSRRASPIAGGTSLTDSSVREVPPGSNVALHHLKVIRANNQLFTQAMDYMTYLLDDNSIMCTQRMDKKIAPMSKSMEIQLR